MSLSTLVDCLAQESCCADRDIWKAVSMYVAISAVVVCGLLLCYEIIRHRERKDTWMKRIKYTYILQRTSWLSDCKYNISYRGTGNEYATNIDVTNDDKLVNALHQRGHDNRVLFVGEPGIGKSHLFRSIARKWANGKILKDVILIYLQLDHVPREACILKEFLKLMKRENSEKEIHSLISELQRKKSIVMLDGISNWSRFCNTTSNNTNKNVNSLTIEELLESNINKFEKMKVWVTSRNIESDMNVMQGNYTEVNLKGFNEEQRKKFFKKFLETEKNGNKIWRFSYRLQRQANNYNDYITSMCSDTDFLTKYPVVVRYLATAYCSEANTKDLQSRVKTYIKDFPDMVETTKAFTKSEKVDLDLLLCLLEVGGTNDDDYKTCAKNLQLEKLVSNHIKDEFLQEALLRLLMTLRDTNRVITSLTICGECPRKLFSCLPKIEQRLVFYNVSFTEIDFIAVIETISQRELTLEFHDSEVPETFPVIKLLDNYSTTNLSVFRYKGEENPAKLSWEEGEWMKQKTVEDIRHNLQENRPREQDYEQVEAFHY